MKAVEHLAAFTSALAERYLNTDFSHRRNRRLLRMSSSTFQDVISDEQHRTRNKQAELQTEESRAEEPNGRTPRTPAPRVSSIDEDEGTFPRASTRCASGRYETMAMLATAAADAQHYFSVMALIALRFTGLIYEYANSVGVSRMDAAVPVFWRSA